MFISGMYWFSIIAAVLGETQYTAHPVLGENMYGSDIYSQYTVHTLECKQ